MHLVGQLLRLIHDARAHEHKTRKFMLQPIYSVRQFSHFNVSSGNFRHSDMRMDVPLLPISSADIQQEQYLL